MRARRISRLLICVVFVSAAAAELVADPLALAGKLPGKSAADTESVCAELAKNVPENVKVLCESLVAPGKGDDTKARFALNGMAKYVTRKGAEGERMAYSKALAEFLSPIEDREIKAFVIRQLQRAGRDEAVGALAECLATDDLCEPAAQALSSIGTPSAVGELAKALEGSSGKRSLTLVQSLGWCRHTDSAKAIAGYLDSKDAATARAARYALANMGSRLVADTLKNDIRKSEGNARSIAAAQYLTLAERLSESGASRDAARICEEVIGNCTGSNEVHILCSALDVLVSVDQKKGAKAVEAAAGTENWVLANKVAGLTSRLGPESAGRVLKKLAGRYPGLEMKSLALRSRKGDRAAASAIAKAIAGDDAERRTMALAHVSALDPKQAADALIEALTKGAAPEQIEPALLLLDGAAISGKAAEVLESGKDPARIAVLNIVKKKQLSKLREPVLKQLAREDAKVRVAALGALILIAAPADIPSLIDHFLAAPEGGEQSTARNALIAACKRAKTEAERGGAVLKGVERSEEAKALLLPVLARIGGAPALDKVVVETRNEDEAIRDIAVRSLCEWQTADAVPGLVALAKSSGSLVHNVLAMRACVRLANASGGSAKDKLAICRQVLTTAKRPEEKREAIAALATVRIPEAVSAVVPYLDDDALKSAAAMTVGRQVVPAGNYRGMEGSDAGAALAKATPLVSDRKLKGQMAAHLKKIHVEPAMTARGSDGFVPLFNGRDLTGWTGAVNGHVVEDGNLVCTKAAKGTIFTAAQYDDFVLRLEFKLTKGANNGLAIRAPMKGNPAYAGMELQIIDNIGYGKLKDWQKHGSIYNVVPAKTGHLKPVGEWNQQEVIADGRRIVVKLNGAVIVDANLDDYVEKHGAKHPGLRRMRGHIGFMSHGARVSFRNIAIKSVTRQMNVPPTGFEALFNGRDFTNWRGLMRNGYDNPVKRAKLSPEEREKQQKIADDYFRQHWSVKDGILHFDGKGSSAATVKQYKDFEMYCDWKTKKGGDSGIYLRGTPQVQIWDRPRTGSGGLYNNRKNPRNPLCVADNPTGQWNTFHIRMIGEKVTVFLNGKLVVDNVVLENYWDRANPIFPKEQIELQCHGHPLDFKNVFIREW